MAYEPLIDGADEIFLMALDEYSAPDAECLHWRHLCANSSQGREVSPMETLWWPMINTMCLHWRHIAKAEDGD